MRKLCICVLLLITTLFVVSFSATFSALAAPQNTLRLQSLASAAPMFDRSMVLAPTPSITTTLAALAAKSKPRTYGPAKHDVECVAKTMYFEARGEGDKGMLAVGHVIKNRMLDGRFPNTACGVVKQGRYANGQPVLYGCQFHWVCDGQPERIADNSTYKRAVLLARHVLTGEAPNVVGKSLFFHALSVKPAWKNYKFRVRVGNHVFYA